MINGNAESIELSTCDSAAKLINNSGLNIMSFSHNKEKLNYQIENIEYPENIVDRYAINELYFGNLIKHNFFVSNKVLNLKL